MKLQNSVIVVAAVAMAAMIQTAQANFVSASLSDLAANGGTLTIGDKTFSGFSYTESGLTSFGAANILVTATEVNPGYYTLTWGGNISLVSGGPATADLKLNYTVTANPGQITAIDQNYTGSAQPAGGAYLSIVENAYVPGNAEAIGHSALSATDLSDPFAEAGDILTIIPPQSTLNITKDIGFGIVNGGYVTVSEIEQSFEQVPEPTTVLAGALLLLPLGASTLRILRRNRMS